MTTLTVQAEDTATAMDQIADQLGPDALILSTTKRDGKIIMRASNESAGATGKKTDSTSFPEFNSMFAAATNSTATGQPKLAPEGIDYSAKASAITAANLHQVASSTPVSESESASAQHAMMQAISMIADRIEMMENRMSGMMLTFPDGLEHRLAGEAPLCN